MWLWIDFILRMLILQITFIPNCIILVIKLSRQVKYTLRSIYHTIRLPMFYIVIKQNHEFYFHFILIAVNKTYLFSISLHLVIQVIHTRFYNEEQLQLLEPNVENHCFRFYS